MLKSENLRPLQGRGGSNHSNIIAEIINIGDNVDYETLISEKFPNCNVEVIEPDFFNLNMLIEYITEGM